MSLICVVDVREVILVCVCVEEYQRTCVLLRSVIAAANSMPELTRMQCIVSDFVVMTRMILGAMMTRGGVMIDLLPSFPVATTLLLQSHASLILTLALQVS